MARVRGITIKLDAQYADVIAAFRKITSQCNDVNRALRDVNKLLKFDGGNTELLRQQQYYYQQDLEKTEEKIRELTRTKEKLENSKDSWKNTEQINAVNRELEEMNRHLTEIKAGKNQLDALKASMEKLDKATELAKNRVKAINEAFEKQKNTSELVKQKQAALKSEYESTAEKIKKIEQALKLLEDNTPTEEMRNEQNRLQTELIETRTDLENIKQEMMACETVSGLWLDKGITKLKTFSDTTGKIGRQMSIVTGAVAAFGAKTIQMASDVESSFQKVMSIVKANGDAAALTYEDAYNGVLQASTKTGVAISDFNEALYQSISASVPASKAIAFTTQAVKLARGGFTDTTKAVDLMTTILNAYGDEADSVTNIMDDLLTTQNRGKTTVDLLASSMGRIIPTSAAAAVKFEQIATAMAVMTKNGISTRYASTYLTSMFNELTTSSGKAAKKLQELTGKTFTQLIKEGYNVGDVLQILQKDADASGITLNNMFGNMRAGQAAMSLMTNKGEEFNNILKDMQNNAGAADKAFKTMDETPAVQMQKALNELKNVAVDVGYQLMPIVTKILKKIAEWVSKYKNLSKENKELINQIVLAVATIGPLLLVISKVSSALSNVFKVVKSVSTAFQNLKVFSGQLTTSIGSLIGQLAGAVGIGVALGAAIGTLIKNLIGYETPLVKTINSADESIKKLSSTADSLKESVSNAQQEINSMNFQNDHVYDLIAELRALTDESGKVVKSQTRAKEIIQQLNALYPELSEFVDETTGSIVVATDAMNKYVAAQEKQAKLDWYNSKVADLIREQCDAQYELQQAEESLLGVQKELQEAYGKKFDKNIYESSTASSELAQTIGILERKEKELQDTIAEKSKIIKESEETINGYSRTFNSLVDDVSEGGVTLKTNLNKTWSEIARDATAGAERNRLAAGNMSMTWAQVAKEAIAFETNVSTAYNRMDASQQQLAQGFIEAWGEIEESLKSGIASSMNLFDEFNGGAETSIQELVTNLEGQLNGVRTWEQNLNTLIAAGINEDLLGQLREAGPASASVVQALVDGIGQTVTDSQGNIVSAWDYIAQLWGEKVQVLGLKNGEAEQLKGNLESNLGRALDGVPELFNQFGGDTWNGFVEGLQSTIPEVTSEVREEAEEIDDAMHDSSLEFGSPSRKFKQYGEWLGQGLVNGINSGKSKVNSAIQALARACDITSYAASLQSKAQYVGQMVGTGLANGMNATLSRVQSVASTLANTATTAIQKASQVHSPSKITTWIGNMIGEGLVVGMKNKMDAVASAASDLVALPSMAASMANAGITNNTQNTTNNNSFSINVNGANANPNDIARTVMRTIQNQMNKKGAVWA